jgi:hypothetical protein
LHDNVRAHTAVSIKQLWQKKKNYSRIKSPIYSPDLSPPDFFLFPIIKSTLKGRRFEDTENIKINIITKLSALNENEFKRVSNNFTGENKTVSYLKIILKNIKKYV